MYAFGMLGSYFSQGVYAVAGPFQGAVDIIVVQQEDGSFKSSPWYVKCGDFQGVLKRREKIVDISVNGIPANFYMLLNSRGEAYFEKEVEDGVLALPSTSSSAEGLEESKKLEGSRSSKAVSMEEGSQAQCKRTADANESIQGNSIDQMKSRTDDLVLETASEVQELQSTADRLSDSSADQPSSNPIHQSSGLQEAENAVLAVPSTSSSADGFQGDEKVKGLRYSQAVAIEEGSQAQRLSTAEANGSTQGKRLERIKGELDNLKSKNTSEVREPLSTVDQLSDSFVDQSSSKLMHQCNSIDQTKVRSSDNLLVSKTASEVREPRSAVGQLSDCSVDQLSSSLIHQSSGLHQAEDVEDARRNAASRRDTSCLNAADHSDSLEDKSEMRQLPDVKCMVVHLGGENLILAEAESTLPTQLADEERTQWQWASKVDPHVQTGNQDGRLLEVDDEVLNTDTSSLETDGAVVCGLNTGISEDWFGSSNCESGDEATTIRNDLDTSDGKTMDELIWNDFKIVTAEDEKLLHDALHTTPVIGVCIDGESLIPDTVDRKNCELVDSSVWVSDALVGDVASTVAVASTEGSIPMQAKHWDASKDGVTSDKNVVCKVEGGPPTEGNKASEIPAIAVVPPPSKWNMWPLTRIRSRAGKASVSEAADTQQALLAATNIAVGSPLTQEILRKNGYYELTQKPKLRSYVPTSAQIESLKLKDGPNKVTFTFPRVLGRTQVDANIYLWKWNTRIVISDVDGTITKSDVLGQFMPLVGRDWSQSGVTRLFSAIKENGYEVLFLSARAISQAYLTRQFLINLKQDGETLPEGPVFISPDGIIPSLYREVVRRAPHEFKISCLEGIRRLFPNDVNPFYAGFGNRDTDEISYLKVGIPKGKIFIINPKGEVMVNNHVDAKSYTSIHALVDDMFPPVYSSEQEDFNSWNYWKLPLPDVVHELSAMSTKVKKGGTSRK